MTDCCNEFARIAHEPGTPVPAGTGLTRRAFVARGMGAALSVYGASRLGAAALHDGIAAAAGGPAQPVLVSVFMPGGADGLSILAPVGDSRYTTLRSTLGLAADAGTAFAEDGRLMWNPAANALRDLHSEGKVSVMPAVGYTGPDQSHFTSRHYWEVGETSAAARHGWLGRYLDRHGVADNPLQGLSLKGSLSPALATATVPVASVPFPDDFTMSAPRIGDPVLGPTFAALGALGALHTSDPALQRARLVQSQVDRIRHDLGPFQGTTASPVTYPGGNFARRLRSLAALLDAGMPIRTVALDAPGEYDTHANQAGSLDANIRATSDTLLAFQRDLEARGLAGRVLTHVWSEFGRRPRQNATGTDHGAAGIGFVIGAAAKGTQVGEFPGLATLDRDGNLRATSDFRSIYCALLEQWLGVDAEPIIPGAAGFQRPLLVAS